MSAFKLRNVAILLLTVLNLILLFELIGLHTTRRSAAEQLSSDITALYEQAGIGLLADTDEPEDSIWPLRLAQDSSRIQEAAEALLGSTLQLDPDSGSTQYVYTSPRGTCEFHRDDSFSAVLGEGATVKDIPGSAKELLLQMGWTGEDPVCAEDPDTGTVTVTAVWSVLGVTVNDAVIRLTYEDSVLTAVSGVFLSGSTAPLRLGSDACISRAAALTDFLGARSSQGLVVEEVVSCERCYRRADSLEAGADLSPCWLIETDAGSFLVDGLTGAVSRQETAPS